LDTHDGIGVVDVKDLLPDEEIERTKEDIFNLEQMLKKFIIQQHTIIWIFIR
jgi:sucrose phosphorylase